MNSRIVSNNLRVAALHRAKVHEFYTNKLGMNANTTNNPNVVLYQFPGSHNASLQIHFSPNVTSRYQPSRNSIYWKIGIAVDDVDEYANSLRAKGVSVGAADQFLDIGYLCHLSDPAGFTVELI